MKIFKSIHNVPLDFTGICQITSSGNIYHMKDGGLHNESGPASYNSSGWESFYYKNKYYGENTYFTNETWIEKVAELKHEEELSIFL